MAVATNAFFLVGGGPVGAGLPNYSAAGGTYPEGAPAILWGQGTPAALAPWTLVNKGSLYMSVNQTDDTTALYMKVDEGGDAADWKRVFAEDEALIDTNDMSASAGIVTGQIAAGTITVEDMETNALSNHTTSILVDISASDSETIPLYAPAALTITKIDIVWVEATTASGAADGDHQIGTASGGAQIVGADTAYVNGQATGSNTTIAIVSGAVAADGSVFQSHDQSSGGGAGTYHMHYLWDFDS